MKQKYFIIALIILAFSISSYAQDLGYIALMGLQFRTAPDSKADRVSGRPVLYFGTTFTILENKGDWSRIKLHDGTTGWSRRIYKGTEYIKKIEHFYYDTYNNFPPIDSEEFLKMAVKKASKWAENSTLTFLYGNMGGLDGRCLQWIAFFHSKTIQGKKLMFGYNSPDSRMDDNNVPTEGFVSNVWEEEWEVNSGTTDGEYNPGWLPHHYTRADGDYISTSKLCSNENMKLLSNKNKKIKGIKIPEFADSGRGIQFIADGDSWIIGMQNLFEFDGYFFHFYRSTGEYKKYNSYLDDIMQAVADNNIAAVSEFMKSENIARREYHIDGPMRAAHSSPLMVAVYKGYIELVDLFITNGAEVNLIAECEGYECMTLLDVSIRNGTKQITKLLKAAGAKRKDHLYDDM